MSNSTTVHNLLKDAEVSPVSTLIEELKNSTTFQDVLTDKIPQDAVLVSHYDPMDEYGDSVLLRTPDNKYFFLNLGSYEEAEGLKYYYPDNVDRFSGQYQEIFDEWFQRIEVAQ
jgi:hypothetical protein